VLVLKRLRDWVIFELISFVVYAACFVGCVYASGKLLINLVWDNPLLAAAQGALGVLVVLLGIGFLLGISFIFLMACYVNPEVSVEERASRNS